MTRKSSLYFLALAFSLSHFFAPAVRALPLQNIVTYATANQTNWKRVGRSLLIAKGVSDVDFYVLEVDPATGAMPVSVVSGGGGGITAGGVNGSISVGTTAVEVKVGASRLVGRKMVTFFPFDADMYWGYSSAVTTANGTPVFKSQLVSIDADDQAQIWLVAGTAAHTARITESP